LPKLKAALGQFPSEPGAVDAGVPGGQAGRPNRGQIDPRAALDQPLLGGDRCHRLFGIDQAVLRHPRDDVVAAFLREAEGDGPGVRRRRRGQAESVADDHVHIGPSSEIIGDVDGPAVRLD
jgi:hypothetical protein